MKKTGSGGAKGHTSKHAGTHKHHVATSKHHPKHHHISAEGRQDLKQARAHTKGKHPHHAKGLALGDALPVCTVEALAMSLRLAGQSVAEDEVAWLWELAGGRELEISEALAAAARFGLAGCRPLGHVGFDAQPAPFGQRDRLAVAGLEELDNLVNPGHALILGVDVPGPHAVLATADGWWSWGELHSPWTRAVSEAWAVSWS